MQYNPSSGENRTFTYSMGKLLLVFDLLECVGPSPVVFPQGTIPIDITGDAHKKLTALGWFILLSLTV